MHATGHKCFGAVTANVLEDQLIRLLLEELCDAHLDTVELALTLPATADWDSHVMYVRALHSKAQRLLAGRWGSQRLGSVADGATASL